MKRLGGFGLLEVFSASPTKHFTALEGGFITTSDVHVADMLRLARNYGVLPNYDCVIPGLNARMPEINAAVGLTMLPHIDEFIANRNRYASLYRKMLADVPGIKFQQVRQGDSSTYNSMGIMVEPSEFGLTNRELAETLKAEGVHTCIPRCTITRRYISRPYTEMTPDRNYQTQSIWRTGSFASLCTTTWRTRL